MSFLLTALKVLTTLSSIVMCLSPLPDTLRIYRRKCTDDISVLPLVSLWGNSFLWLLYGYLDENFFPIVTTSAFGCVSSLIYIAAYFKWTHGRRYVVKLNCVVLLGLLFVTLYAVLGVVGVTRQSREQVRDVVGFVAVSVNIFLYASPFETVRQVLKTKSAATLPIAMCGVAAVNCSLWLICGIVDNDMFIVTPNVIGVTLSVIQVKLYVIYNPKRKSPARERYVSGNGEGALSALNDSTRSKDGSCESHFSLLISPKDDFPSTFPCVKIADQQQSLVFDSTHSPILLAPPTPRV